MPSPQTPPPLDGNPVTIAAKGYENNCHYVALISIKCDLAQRAYEYICSSALHGRCEMSRGKRYSIKCRIMSTK